MEGSSFVAPSGNERAHVLRCTECGSLFLSHDPGDSAEVVCNACFEVALAPASEAHERLLAEERERLHRIAA